MKNNIKIKNVSIGSSDANGFQHKILCTHIRYVGQQSHEYTRHVQSLYEEREKSKLPFVPTLVKFDQDTFYFASNSSIEIEEFFKNTDFDLSERLTIAKKIVENVTKLYGYSYCLTADDDHKFPFYICPISYEILLFDLRHILPMAPCNQDMQAVINALGRYFKSILFCNRYDQYFNGKTPFPLSRIIEKMMSDAPFCYRSLRSVLKDISHASLSYKRSGSIPELSLDETPMLTQFIVSNLDVHPQHVQVLKSTLKSLRETTTQLLHIYGADDISKNNLVDKFLESINDSTQIFTVDAKNSPDLQGEGVAFLIYGFLQKYVIPFDQRCRTLKSLISVRYPEEPAQLAAYLSPTHSEILGLARCDFNPPSDKSILVSEIRQLCNFDRRSKLLVIYNYSHLDSATQHLITDISKNNAIGNLMIVALEDSEQLNKYATEEENNVFVERYNEKRLESLLKRSFPNNRFNDIRKISELMVHESDGIIKNLIAILNTMALTGAMYVDDTGCWFIDESLIEKGMLLYNDELEDASHITAQVLTSVDIYRVIAISGFGVSADEMSFFTEIPKSVVDSTISQLLLSDTDLRRRDQRYFITNQGRIKSIIDGCPESIAKELCTRFTAFYVQEGARFSPKEMSQRISHVYQYLYRYAALPGQPYCAARVFMLAGHEKLLSLEWDDAIEFLNMSIKSANISSSEYCHSTFIYACLLLMKCYLEKRDLDSAKSLYKFSLQNITDSIDGASIAIAYIDVLKSVRQFDDAFSIAIKAVEALGFPLHRGNFYFDTVLHYILINRKCSRMTDSQLANIKNTNDPRVKVANKLYAQLVIICYQDHRLSKYVSLIILRCMRLALEHGATVEYSLALMGFAYLQHTNPVSWGYKRDIEAYYSISKEIMARFKYDEFVFLFCDFVYLGILQPWKQPLSDVIEQIDKRLSLSRVARQGEMTGFFSGARYLLSVMNGANAKDIEKKIAYALPEIIKNSPGTPMYVHDLLRDTMLNVIGGASNVREQFKKKLLKVESENRNNYTIIFTVAFCGLLASTIQGNTKDAIKYFLKGLRSYFLGAGGLAYIVPVMQFGLVSLASVNVASYNSLKKGKLIPLLLRSFTPFIYLIHRVFKRWNKKYPGRYQHLVDYSYAERFIFMPGMVDRCAEKMNQAFKTAIENQYYLDGLVIGFRILDIVNHYGVENFGLEDTELQVQKLAYKLGMHSNLAVYRQKTFDRRKESLGLDIQSILKVYTGTTVYDCCDQAYEEITSFCSISVMSVLLSKGDSISEVFRASGSEKQHFDRLVRRDDPFFDYCIYTAVRQYGSIFGHIICQSDDTHKQVSVCLLKAQDETIGAIYLEHDEGDNLVLTQSILEIVASKFTNFIEAMNNAEISRQLKVEQERSRERLAHISHEIKTPINGLVNLSVALRKKLAECEFEGDTMRFADNIAICAQSLACIQKSVESISKDDLTPQALPINLHETLLAPFVSLEPLFVQKGVDLKFPDLSKIPIKAEGDQGKIAQIISNMLHNALKHTSKGSVSATVKAKTQDKTISLEICICDTGEGIPEEALRKVTRKNASQVMSQTAGEGSGIGLYLSTALAELMGGMLVINSTVAAGTEVVVIINLGVVSELFFEKTVVDLNGLTILCVDDDETNHLVYDIKLSETECKVLHAYDGFSALDIVTRTRVDLVLMDFDMPGINGVDAASMIREQTGYDSPPILCVSAYDCSYIEHAHPGASMLFNGILEKVLDNKTFYIKIAQILGRQIQIRNDHSSSMSSNSTKIAGGGLMIDQIALLAAYRSDLSVAKRLLNRLTDTYSDASHKIMRALAVGDVDAVRKYLHALKGLACNVGARTLAISCQVLSDKVIIGQDSVDELARFDDVVAETIAESEEILQKIALIHQSSDDYKNPETLLAEINSDLERNSLLVIKKLKMLSDTTQWGNECLKLIRGAISAVEAGNFALARSEMRELNNAK